MARMHCGLRPLPLPLLLLAMLVVLSIGQYGSGAKIPTKNAVATARKEEVKYIKCGVCEEIVKQLYRQVKKKKGEIAPRKVLSGVFVLPARGPNCL